MERASIAISAAINNNIVINTALIGSCGLLSMRSKNHQNQIESLEAEKESLTQSNKSMMKSMWDWKQQLFSEAENAGENAVVSISRLKEIYGEALVPKTGDAVVEDAKSPASKLVI